MFFRLFKYSMFKSVRRKDLLFWNLLFPIALGTLFFVTFGSYMEKEEIFKEIPVAYVEEALADETFGEVLEEIEDSDDALLLVSRMEYDEAQAALEAQKIEGIYYNSADGIKLYVVEEGIKPSILQSVLEQYERTKHTISTIAATHPETLESLLAETTEEVSIIQNEKYTDSKMDLYTNYFYALIAMTCLYGCFVGVTCAVEFKADSSSLAARRCVASTNRFEIMAADILSNLILQTICSSAAVLYIKYVLGVALSDKLLMILIVTVVASFIGIATGFFIGSVGKGAEGSKTSIAVAVTMLECFLSGLMVENMYYIIQKHVPVLNKINPAALVVDALYSLDIYEDYGRFTQNVIFLIIIALLLCIGSFLAVRRERYASI